MGWSIPVRPGTRIVPAQVGPDSGDVRQTAASSRLKTAVAPAERKRFIARPD